jgi:hypothetical protein
METLVPSVQAHQEWQRRIAENAHAASDAERGKNREATVTAGIEAMKVALLINGGAAVAAMALVGALVGRGGATMETIRPVLRCLYWFGGGTVLAAFTAGSAFFAFDLYSGSAGAREKQWDYPYVVSTPKSDRLYNAGWWCTLLGTTSAGLALVAFIIGVIVAAKAVAKLHFGGTN